MAFNSSGFELTDWKTKTNVEGAVAKGKLSRRSLLKLIGLGSLVGVGGYFGIKSQESPPPPAPKTLAEWLIQNKPEDLGPTTQLQVTKKTSLLHHPFDETSTDRGNPATCELPVGTVLIVAEPHPKLKTVYHNHCVRVRLHTDMQQYGWVKGEDATPPLLDFDESIVSDVSSK
jgi:hypothetical protein